MWVRAVESLKFDPPAGVNLTYEDREDILGNTAAKLLGIK